jgi:CRISPR/Cas system-associated protein Cas10 (large subunit of type III CRISPR-Cas system)
MTDIPVERRTYFPHQVPADAAERTCPVCGRHTLVPWYLRRDRERHVWRRWVCIACQAHQDLPEDESA